MALILYTWGNKLVKKRFMGVRPCPQCGNFTEQYLRRQYFTAGVFYIPIIWVPTKRYYVCENCQSGVQLDKKKFNELKKQYKNMPQKSKVITAFNELQSIAPTLSETDRNTDSVYEKITQSVKFSDGESPFIKEMISGYFSYAAALAANARSEAQSVPDAESTGAAGEPENASVSAVNTAEETDTAASSDAPAVRSVPAAGNPLGNVPRTGTQTIYTAQTTDGQTVVTSEQRPVRKRKWGWLAAGIIQTIITLFTLFVMVLGIDPDMFTYEPVFGVFWIILLGIIPVGLTVLFYYLYAKK